MRNLNMIKTKFRKIVTDIPSPNYKKIIKDLDKYEARSMHGQLPVLWDKAKDFQVWDKDGNCWIDFTSTIFVSNSGHSNSSIKKALIDMIEKDLLHSYTFPTEIRLDYLKKLISIVPKQFQKAFLLSSGTEATECAIKLMRMHGINHNKNPGIISFEDAMHGRTMGAQMLGGNLQSRSWIGYDDPNIHRVEFPYPWLINDNFSGKQKFQKDMEYLGYLGVDFDKDICGFMLEAYIGWGAVFYPTDYIKELCEFAKKHHILICVDEIQGGFGRTGKLFAYQHYNNLEPDIVCCGKGMSSSLPLSAVLGRGEIMDTPDIGSMSSTHSANPLSCAAGLANILEMTSKNLVKESERKGKILHSRLEKLKQKYRHRISYVLGKGLLAAILFRNPKTGTPDSEFATKVCYNAMKKGLLLVHTGRESIKIGPPLIIPDDALIEGLNILEESIRELK